MLGENYVTIKKKRKKLQKKPERKKKKKEINIYLLRQISSN